MTISIVEHSKNNLNIDLSAGIVYSLRNQDYNDSPEEIFYQ